ncbi:putative transporter [Colletotrichum higginsianum]|uniref:Putative transporter n=1 Tax=Colletotrichum higginsianum TaxID=80884 RepID=A0A4T0VDB4_9PEZI|nr:putative transporter [Colletotrichum higginsianum]
MAVETSINAEQPKPKDLEIAEKRPSVPGSIDGDLKAGQVELLDEAEIFLQQNGISHAQMRELFEDEDAKKKLVRKIDLTLLPLLMGTYLLQYIDKQALSYGAVFDLFETTNTTQSQYSWLASIFYFAYLVAEWPASYLAQHFPTGTVVSVFVVSWGTVLTCTAASHSFAGLAVCRFLLGAFEAVITPCFMMIVSMWYTRAEAPMRAGSFYCFNGFGSMVGGILFYGVGQADGWDVWRIIFVMCGGLTIAWGIFLFFYLPNNIMTAKRYTVEEKALLIARSQSNNTGVFSRKIKPAQIKEAFRDPQVWLLFFYTLLNEIVNGGIANFGKLIVKGFAKDALLTTAYGIPYGAWVAFFIFTGPLCASKFKNFRTIVMMTWVLPTLVAVSLFLKLDRANKNGLLMAYYISSFVGALVVALQMPAANVAGYTKRVTSTAFVFLAYCVGNIIGPQAFLASEAPIYGTGCKVIMGCTAGQVVLAISIRILLKRRNKRRDAEAEASGQDEDDEVLMDLTDFENRKFRYSY